MKFQSDEHEGKLQEVEQEIKKAQKQIIFWLANEKIKAEKNPIKKTVLKLERKLT